MGAISPGLSWHPRRAMNLGVSGLHLPGLCVKTVSRGQDSRSGIGGREAQGLPLRDRALTSSSPELGVQTGRLAPTPGITPGTGLWASVSSSIQWARCGVRMWEICLSGSLLSLPDPWNRLCLVIQ